MGKISRSIIVFFILFMPLFPLVRADVIYSGKQHSLNLPSQTTLIYGRRTHWVFFYDESKEELLMIFSNDTQKWLSPFKIADCGFSHDYDIYPRSPHIYVVVYPSKEAGEPLICRVLRPYHNQTFVDEDTLEIVPSIPDKKYSNPSILVEDEEIYVSYHNEVDGHLYLTIYGKFTTQISEKPTNGTWCSKIFQLLNGTKIIAYSDGKAINCKLLHDTWIGEEKTITDEALRWNGAWTVNWIPDMDRTHNCAGLSYQGNDTYIKFVPYSLSLGWGDIVSIANSTYDLAPTMARMLNDSYLVAWLNPDLNELIYAYGTSNTGWNQTRILPLEYKVVKPAHVELCFTELQTGLIGITLLTNEGIYFDAFEISTGYIPKARAKRYSPTMTALKISLILMLVFTLGLRMFGITKWKLSDL